MADSLIQGANNPDQERQAIIAKWKDKPQDELLNAKAESDIYIKTLTTRFDDLAKDHLKLKEEHQASADLKTLIETMKKQANPDTTVVTQTVPDQPAIKPEDFRLIAAEEFANQQKIMKQRDNFNSVQVKLKEAFGDNYVDAYKSRLDQLGLSPEYADDLAKNHPAVFVKTFDLDTKPLSNINLPRNTQRPSSFAPTTQKRDWAYYQEMKKSNPKLYLDPKIAIQMHNDAIELGDAFGMPD